MNNILSDMYILIWNYDSWYSFLLILMFNIQCSLKEISAKTVC